MGVTTTKTNKPFNPRGNDQSPKGYNRASLFSGKALDFDGVNDYVDLDGFTMAGDVATIVFYGKFSNDGRILDLNPNRFIIENTASSGLRVYNNTSYNVYGTTDRDKVGFYAIVSDGTTQRAYYNGQQLGSDETITALDWDSVTNMKLGAYFGGGSVFLDGQIAGFKIFNTALTAAQVADLYNNPEKVVPTGVDNTALKLWLPMMEGAGTYCINGADPLGDDVYNGAGSFDSATGWTLNPGTSITGGKLVVDGTQTSTTSAYYNVSSLGSKLIFAEFTLSNVTAGQAQLAFFAASGTAAKTYTESGTYTELVAVGSGHNGNTGFIMNSSFVGDIDNFTIKEVSTGAISGATWTHGIGAPVAQTAVIDWNKKRTSNTIDVLLPQGLTTGRDITGVNLFENVRKQGALNLDGNSWAEVHDNASLDLGSGQLSLEAWVRMDELGIYQVILEKGQAGIGSNRGFMLRVKNNNLIQITITGDNEKQITSNAIAQGDWTHLCITKDALYFNLYIDGVYIVQAINPTGGIDTAEPLLIGKDKTNGWQVNGSIAQPRIYNRALTAEEVQRNYNAGKNTYTN